MSFPLELSEDGAGGVSVLLLGADQLALAVGRCRDRGPVPDAAPAPAGEAFDYSEGTAPGRDAESVKREDGAIAQMTGQK